MDAAEGRRDEGVDLARHGHLVLDGPPDSEQGPLKNPLYTLWKQHEEGGGDFADPDAFIAAMRARNKATSVYAWAVPTEPVIRKLVEFSGGKIVEIGAGTGYWALLLSRAGANVMAYDRDPPGNPFHPVHVGGPEEVSYADADRTLMLCWPPYGTPMARDSLSLYRGKTLIYVGESDGCTGCASFTKALEARWDLIEVLEIPQWYGIHDAVWLFRRGR